MIKFDHVAKKFGKITALDEISFDISDGEFVFVTGPSGAGKTTLIRLLLKEYPPSAGQITFNDNSYTKSTPKDLVKLRRQIGVVFQDFKLLQDRTVFENVALALKVLGKKETDIKHEVLNVLELVGLKDRANLFPRQLAGGELQRACLARAVVAKPLVVIADEPTGNLDPATAWQIVELLKKINQQGRTIIMTTHNFEIVNKMKERVIKIDKGRVVSDQKEGTYR